MPALLAPLDSNQLAERKVDLIRQLRAWVIADLKRSSSAEVAIKAARDIRTINTLLKMREVSIDA